MDTRAEAEPAQARPAERVGWLRSLGALAILATFTAAVCLVYWPGHMNNDTIGQFEYAQAGRYNDWHSAFYGALWHVAIAAGLRSIGWALAASVLVLLAGLYLILRARLSRPWALLGAAAVFAFPPVLGFDVLVGTDAWFAACLLCAFGLVIRAARTDGRSRAVSAILAIALAFLAQAARATAAPAVAMVPAALAVVLLSDRLGGWRRVLSVGAIGLAGGVLLYGSTLGFQRYVLRADQVHPEQETFKYDLVSMSVRTHEVLLPPSIYPRQDLAFLDTHSSASTVVNVDLLMWGPYASIPPLVEGQQLDSLRQAWLSAVLHHPNAYLRSRLHTALWQLTIEGDPATVYYLTPTPYGYPPPYPALTAAAQSYVAIGTTPEANGGPLQRVWIYMVVLLGVVVLGVLSRRRIDVVFALIAAGLLLYSAVLLMIAPIVTYRYMYPAVTTASVTLVVLTAAAGRALVGRIRRA